MLNSTFKLAPWARNLVCLAVVMAIPFAAGNSQMPVNGNGVPIHDGTGVPPMNPAANPTPDANRYLEDSMKAQNSRKQIEQLNLLRQKEMTADTQKLVILAIQLKAVTDQTSREKLSVAELRKAELIEKLAKSVHDKMKASAGN